MTSCVVRSRRGVTTASAGSQRPLCLRACRQARLRELPAQFADMAIDRAIQRIASRQAGVDQFAAAEDAVRVLCEMDEEAKLGQRQGKPGNAFIRFNLANLMCFLIDLKRSGAQDTPARSPAVRRRTALVRATTSTALNGFTT